ncbi:YciI family protein [Actinoplanes sp. CA-054009]
MAKYTLLIYGDPAQWEAITPEQRKEKDRAHEEFQAAAGSRILGGQELEYGGSATTLRAPGVTTDGPFAETKEILGGFYVIEAADLDEVLALATLLPEVHDAHSAVEIRPVVDHG